MMPGDEKKLSRGVNFARFMLRVFLPAVFYIYVLAVGVLIVNSSRNHEPVSHGVATSIIAMLVIVGVLGLLFYLIENASNDGVCCFVSPPNSPKKPVDEELGPRPAIVDSNMTRNNQQYPRQSRQSTIRPAMFAPDTPRSNVLRAHG